MTAPLTPPPVVNVVEEVLKLGCHYGIPREEIGAVLDRLAPWLGTYAELVLCEQGFEIITGGIGRDLAPGLAAVARAHSLPADVAARFVDATDHVGDVMFGLKVPVGCPEHAPTLYARCAVPIEAGLDLVAGLLRGDTWRASLTRSLPGVRHLYGFGLTVDRAGRPVAKTYTLSRDACALEPQLEQDAAPPGRSGFLSWRVAAVGACREHKRYLAEVDLRSLELSGCWRRHLQLAVDELGYEVAGHLGRTFVDGRPGAWKLYVERIGGIPNDETLA